MKACFSFLVLFSIVFQGFAQKYKSEEGKITFFSDAPIEDIAATNEKASSLFDLTSGEIAFIVPIVDFEFEKSLMKEHFNEKYMETEKFPTASFKGKIAGYDKTILTEQAVIANGALTIHGQSSKVSVKGTLQVQNGMINVKSSFMVELKDYKIKIPKLLWQNIAEKVEVKTEFTFKAIQ